MSLDPATADYLATLAETGGTPYEDMASADEARAAYRQVVEARRGGAPVSGTPCSVEHYQLDGLWYRVFRPQHVSAFDAPLPVVIYFHGGGWVVGDVHTHEEHCRAFAALPAVVVAVEYRLAPEHPYPAAHEDAWQAITYVASEMRKTFHADRLVLAGDSAGGLLAAAMAAKCRDTDGAPEVAAQCLIYPAMEPAMGSASHDDLAEGYGLTRKTMQWFYDAYAPGPGFSPSDLSDLSGLAPAVVATAGYDLLKDDGLRYGDRLRDAGVPTTSLHFPGLIHGFFGMAGASPAAAGAMRATVAAVAGHL